MTSENARRMTLACLLALWVAAPFEAAPQEKKPQVKIPDAGVPQIMTIEGQYVRVAYNNEGYVVIGYRTANNSVGEEWMLLEMGATVRDGTPSFKMQRDALSLSTPDNAKVPLPTIQEYRKADLRALDNRARVVRDSINYFPPSAATACRIGFFADQSSPAMAWDQVELSNTRGCLGRVYFKVPGGIKHGQYFLDVKFPQSVVRVPFRILTEEEDKLLSKNYKDIRKQVQEAFKPKKKTE